MQISRTIALVTLTAAVLCASSLAYAVSLDVPSDGDTLSGIGIIHGWKCEAEGAITIRFDGGGPIPATYGFPRGDTSQTCGGDDGTNGFYAFYNWAILGDGEHTAVAYDDGVPFARATFTVVTTGEEFLDNAPGTAYASDWPSAGENARLVWNESTQHFELAEVGRHVVIPAPPPDPPSPPVQGKMYWTGDGRIRRANLDGTQVETLLVGENAYSKIALDLARGKMYWTNNRGIYRANLDGSQVETLMLGDDIDSFALDPVGGKMYWTDGGASTILWANLDGTQVETFLPADPLLPDIDRPSLVLDLAGGKIYWMDRIDGGHPERMRRANLDGTQVETLFTTSNQHYWDVEVFALDLAKGKFYWIDNGVYRANLADGSHVENLVSRTGDGTGLVLDLAGGKMYWTLWDARGPYDEGLYRANLDGSQVEALVTTDLYEPYGLALALE